MKSLRHVLTRAHRNVARKPFNDNLQLLSLRTPASQCLGLGHIGETRYKVIGLEQTKAGAFVSSNAHDPSNDIRSGPKASIPVMQRRMKSLHTEFQTAFTFSSSSPFLQRNISFSSNRRISGTISHTNGLMGAVVTPNTLALSNQGENDYSNSLYSKPNHMTRRQSKERLQLVLMKIRNVWLRSSHQSSGAGSTIDHFGKLPSFEEMVNEDLKSSGGEHTITGISNVENFEKDKYTSLTGADAALYRVIQYLHMFDIRFADIERLSVKCPDLFALSIEGNLAPKAQFLHELGLSTRQIAQVFIMNPFFFTHALNTIKERIETLLRIGYPPERVAKSLILRNDWLVGASNESIYPKLAFLRKHFVLSSSQKARTTSKKSSRMSGITTTVGEEEEGSKESDDIFQFFLNPGPEVAWLVKSNLGLFMQSWRSVALRNLRHLKQNGLSQQDILKLIPLVPALMKNDLVPTMQQQSQFFVNLSKGVVALDDEAVTTSSSSTQAEYIRYYYRGVLLQSPQILAYSISSLETRLRFFSELGLSGEDAARLFVRHPGLASPGLRYLAEKVTTLASDLSLELPNMTTLHKTAPHSTAASSQPQSEEASASKKRQGFQTRSRSRSRHMQTVELDVVEVFTSLKGAPSDPRLSLDYSKLIPDTDIVLPDRRASENSLFRSDCMQMNDYTTVDKDVQSSKEVTGKVGSSKPRQKRSVSIYEKNSLAALIHAYPALLTLRMEQNIVPKISVLHAFVAAFVELLDSYGALGRSLVRDPELRTPTPRTKSIVEFQSVIGALFAPHPLHGQMKKGSLSSSPSSTVSSPADMIAANAADALVSELKKRRLQRSQLLKDNHHGGDQSRSSTIQMHEEKVKDVFDQLGAALQGHEVTNIDHVRHLAHQAAKDSRDMSRRIDRPFLNNEDESNSMDWFNEEILSSIQTFSPREDDMDLSEWTEFEVMEEMLPGTEDYFDMDQLDSTSWRADSKGVKRSGTNPPKFGASFHTMTRAFAITAPKRNQPNDPQTKPIQERETVEAILASAQRKKGTTYPKLKPPNAQKESGKHSRDHGKSNPESNTVHTELKANVEPKGEANDILSKEKRFPSERLSDLLSAMNYLMELRRTLQSSQDSKQEMTKSPNSESNIVPIEDIATVLHHLQSLTNDSHRKTASSIPLYKPESMNQHPIACTASSTPLDLARRVSRFTSRPLLEQMRAPSSAYRAEVLSSKTTLDQTQREDEEDVWYQRQHLNDARARQQPRQQALVAALAVQRGMPKGASPLIPMLSVEEPLDGSPAMYPKLDGIQNWVAHHTKASHLNLQAERLDGTGYSDDARPGFFRKLFHNYPFRVHEAARELICRSPVHICMSSLETRLLPRLAAILIYTSNLLANISNIHAQSASGSEGVQFPRSNTFLRQNQRARFYSTKNDGSKVNLGDSYKELEKALRQAALELKEENSRAKAASNEGIEASDHRDDSYTAAEDDADDNDDTSSNLKQPNDEDEPINFAKHMEESTTQKNQLQFKGKTDFGELIESWDVAGPGFSEIAQRAEQGFYTQSSPFFMKPDEQQNDNDDDDEFDELFEDPPRSIRKSLPIPRNVYSPHFDLNSLPGLRLRSTKELQERVQACTPYDITVPLRGEAVVLPNQEEEEVEEVDSFIAVDFSKAAKTSTSTVITPQLPLHQVIYESPAATTTTTSSSVSSVSAPLRKKRKDRMKKEIENSAETSSTTTSGVKKPASPFRPTKPWLSGKYEETEVQLLIQAAAAEGHEDSDKIPKLNIEKSMWPYAIVTSVNNMREIDDYSDILHEPIGDTRSHLKGRAATDYQMSELLLPSSDISELDFSPETPLSMISQPDSAGPLNSLKTLLDEVDGAVKNLNNVDSGGQRNGAGRGLLEGGLPDKKSMSPEMLQMLEAEADLASEIEEKLLQRLEHMRKTGDLIDEELNGDVDYAELDLDLNDTDQMAIDGRTNNHLQSIENYREDDDDDDDADLELDDCENEEFDFDNDDFYYDDSVVTNQIEQALKVSSTREEGKGSRPYLTHPDSKIPLLDSVITQLIPQSKPSSQYNAVTAADAVMPPRPFDLSDRVGKVMRPLILKSFMLPNDFTSNANDDRGKNLRGAFATREARVLADSAFKEAAFINASPLTPLYFPELFGRLGAWLEEASLDATFDAKLQQDLIDKRAREELLVRAHAEAPGLELVYLAEFLAAQVEDDIEAEANPGSDPSLSLSRSRGEVRRLRQAARREAYLMDYAEMLWDGKCDSSGDGLSKLITLAIDTELSKAMKAKEDKEGVPVPASNEAALRLMKTLVELRDRIQNQNQMQIVSGDSVTQEEHTNKEANAKTRPKSFKDEFGMHLQQDQSSSPNSSLHNLSPLIEGLEGDENIEDYILNEFSLRTFFQWSDSRFQEVFGELPKEQVLGVQNDLYELARRMHYLRLLQQPDCLSRLSK